MVQLEGSNQRNELIAFSSDFCHVWFHGGQVGEIMGGYSLWSLLGGRGGYGESGTKKIFDGNSKHHIEVAKSIAFDFASCASVFPEFHHFSLNHPIRDWPLSLYCCSLSSNHLS